MDRKEIALRLGGAGLCKLALGKLVLKEDVNGGPPIVVSGAGFKITLDFLVRVGARRGDLVIEELLPILPSLSCLDNFLSALPSYEATPEEFEYLVELGHII